RRVRLTALGERLRDAAEPAYADLQRALADVYATGREISGELRLGVLVSSSGGPALIDIIQAFESRHGGCRVQIVELALSDSLEPLRRGEVDLMAIRLPIAQPDLTAGPVLSREERVVAVATDHPFAAREAVSLEDLADQTVADGTNLPPELREGLSPSYTPRGRPITRAAPMDTIAEILAAVARGELVHPTVPSLQDYYGRPGVAYVPFSDAPPSESGLVWRTASSAHPAIRAFVRVAREILSDSRL
ncbi:MAG: substrate-binding domain-containing protein, partial [Thermoleophilaceae bacterium]